MSNTTGPPRPQRPPPSAHVFPVTKLNTVKAEYTPERLAALKLETIARLAWMNEQRLANQRHYQARRRAKKAGLPMPQPLEPELPPKPFALPDVNAEDYLDTLL